MCILGGPQHNTLHISHSGCIMSHMDVDVYRTVHGNQRLKQRKNCSSTIVNPMDAGQRVDKVSQGCFEHICKPLSDERHLLYTIYNLRLWISISLFRFYTVESSVLNPVKNVGMILRHRLTFNEVFYLCSLQEIQTLEEKWIFKQHNLTAKISLCDISINQCIQWKQKIRLHLVLRTTILLHRSG